MNCKPGDLAVYVGVNADLIGKILRCIRYEVDEDEDGGAWIVDPPLHEPRQERDGFYPGNWVSDAALRPIRGQEGEDEMLRLVGKPNEATA